MTKFCLAPHTESKAFLSLVDTYRHLKKSPNLGAFLVMI